MSEADALERRHEDVDIFGRVVEGERRAHGAFQAGSSQDGLGAVVAGPHGDAYVAEGGADVFVAQAIDKHSGPCRHKR